MEKNTIAYMDSMYTKLRTIVPDKLENDSVFLTLIRKDNTPVLKLLNDAAVRSSEIPYSIAEDLKDNGYIEDGIVEGTFVISARGLWDIEKKKGLLSEHQLVEYFQEKKFDNKFIDSKLNDIEKVLIFSMISVRAFSEDSCVNLMGDRQENVLNGWEQIIASSADFLSATKIINTIGDKILVKKGNEHPVNFLFQHTDRLPKKTRFFYQSIGRQRRYFLDISESGNISKTKLTYLLTQVFEKKMDYDNIQITIDHCKCIAYDYSVSVFSSKNHNFADPECDRVIEDAITQAILGL